MTRFKQSLPGYFNPLRVTLQLRPFCAAITVRLQLWKVGELLEYHKVALLLNSILPDFLFTLG